MSVFIGRRDRNACGDITKRRSWQWPALTLALLALSAAPSQASETITYTYDALGRLVQVLHSGTVNQGAYVAYQYDKADNRTNVTMIASWNAPAHLAGDFNGDGMSDILWRDASGTGASYVTGTVTDWLAKASGDWSDNWGNAATGVADTSWQIAGIGDFNGDGESDILWRHVSGRLTDWLANPPPNANGGFTDNSANALTSSADNSWQIVGIGDFDGDGKSDILWRNSGGYVAEWLGTSNGAFKDNTPVAGTGVADSTWHVVGVGDFNGDGFADILWRNDNESYAEWLANATLKNGSFTSNSAVSFGVDASWKVIGIGDFNCDGRADILWRKTNGDLTEWQAMSNGNFVTQSTPYYNFATTLRVAAIGNFNGNHTIAGKKCDDDLLMRDTAGNLTEWLGSATGAFTQNNAATAAVGTNWNIEPR